MKFQYFDLFINFYLKRVNILSTRQTTFQPYRNGKKKYRKKISPNCLKQ